MCFDTGHTMAFRCGKEIGEQIKEVGDLIKVLHVHDTYGNADQHNLPGIGCTDWKAVSDERHEPDERHAFPYRFVDYVRP